MNRFLALALLLLMCAAPALHAQSRLRLMEYNVENLFDTIHAEGKADTEFLPAAERHWNGARYWKKLARLSRVIAAAGEDAPVDLVALVEIENDSVAYDLVRRTRLHRLGYEYLMTHGPDGRGINVALLYRPGRFCPVEKDSLRIPPPTPRHSATRDVLHVAGRLQTGDTLDLYVCHLPSRRGGKRADAYRRLVAGAVKAHADSVQRVRAHPLVVLTGDFNASYPERLYKETLGTLLPGEGVPQPRALYLLTHGLRASADIRGTYKYQGRWQQLDQFIVNGNLLTAQCHTPHEDGAPACRILDYPILLKNDASGEGVHPLRTFLGPYYQGGISDHLPLTLDLCF